MRTAIFMGLIAIADAIYKVGQIEVDYSHDAIRFLALILLTIMIMDVADFFRKR